jgi:hypothetical protein
MLQIPSENADFVQGSEASSAKSTVGLLAEIVASLRRRRGIISRFIGLGPPLGRVYIFLSTPTYTALPKLTIDTHKSPSGQPQTILGDPIASWFTVSRVPRRYLELIENVSEFASQMRPSRAATLHHRGFGGHEV